jgi:hypothetical protein
MKSLLLVSQRAQIAFLPDLVRREDFDVLALGLDVEEALREKGVKFISSEQLRRVSTPNRLKQARHIGEQLQRRLEEKDLRYRGISFARLYTPTFQYYVSILFYYLDILSEVIKDNYSTVYTFELKKGRNKAIPFEELVTGAVHAALRLVGESQSFVIEVVPAGQPERNITNRRIVPQIIYRQLQLIALSTLNVYMTYGRRKKRVSILASEYWKNIKPLLAECPDAELILIDRSEVTQIGLRSIFKHRMRFIHPGSFLSAREIKRLKEKAAEYIRVWKIACHQIKEGETYLFKEIPLTNAISNMLDVCLNDVERLLLQIDGVYKLMEETAPDCVLVRAGISVQTHFAVLCEVARAMGIPSIENQHGILSGFEGDFTSNPHSAYIASYGPLAREELEKHNFAPNSIFLDVGSPRFDIYSKIAPVEKKKPETGVRILHIGPPLSPGLWTDSYDVKAYFQSIAKASKNIDKVHVTIKLRGHDNNESLYRTIISDVLGDISHTISFTESLAELFKETDIVVSCHSTAFLEAMIAGRPVVMDATLPIFSGLANTDLTLFEKERALIVARTENDFSQALESLAADFIERQQAGERARTFVADHFLLGDGKSSKRLAKALYSLVGK